MSLAESIAEQLGGKKCGSGWVVPAICHDSASKKRNLQISDGQNGRLSAYCHSNGCNYRTIMRALEAQGLKPVDRLPPQNKSFRRQAKQASDRFELMRSLNFEMVVLMKFLDSRLGDRAKSQDKNYLKIHPQFVPLPSDLWDREAQALRRVGRLSGQLLALNPNSETGK